jgi:hydrophobic/amphiphilic exporter-1 (mainly G- bacteria), HAE1 family
MLVPMTTVPVTIIGAFAGMAALGFTINLSTLFAIVLAIGIVVDDAIVVVEGAAHHIERGLPQKEAAIQAMNELFGPIVGITLVLMSVFLPAAFIPGLTGQMFAQFALVIAATALLSAVNAATLKPTQCALWLRQPVPPERRNFFFRAFNAVYDPFERAYARLIGGMVARSALMCLVALTVIGGAIYGLARIPTGFLPIEDQGYVLVSVQLPDGASLERTKSVMDQVSTILGKNPAVANVISISGISLLDNNATLANGGVVYCVLKDWSERGKGEDMLSLFQQFGQALSVIDQARIVVFPPPPIQGIGNAAGFSMQLQLRDGSFDLNKLQSVTNSVVKDAQTQSGLQRVTSSFRSTVPQLKVDVDRAKAQTLQVTIDDVFTTLSAYLGSSYVDQFNKFGHVFQVYVQADSKFRLRAQDIELLPVRNKQGEIIPIGTMVRITPSVGPSLLSLYNVYPSSNVSGLPAKGFSSGEAADLMEQIATKVIPSGMGYEWTAMSYQEKLVGNQIYYIFALAMLLVYLVLAGQYESWLLPVAVLLAVPLSLLGPVVALKGLGLDNNLYTQIGLVLLIALSAKNAILIVEVARERRIFNGKSIIEAAVEAARVRFRPILMTSFAFILGVVPLVLATGAGASARKSIGIAVFSGMLASTCLAVLFVPSFFVVVRRFEESRAARKQAGGKPTKVAPAE